jgi:hypothetical protein
MVPSHRLRRLVSADLKCMKFSSYAFSIASTGFMGNNDLNNNAS